LSEETCGAAPKRLLPHSNNYLMVGLVGGLGFCGSVLVGGFGFCGCVLVRWLGFCGCVLVRWLGFEL